MRANILKWALIAVIVAGLGFFLFNHPRQSPNSAQTADSQTIIGLPIRIQIPSINVDAVIEQVGLTPDGAMDVPKSPLNTAWYNLGTRPGETGSAVIDGHVNWLNNSKAVFFDLHSLKPGDKIIVQDESEKNIRFVVSKSRSLDPNADATEVFNSNDGLSHLNLITCEGVWNKTTNSYSQRLIIFADKEIN